MTRKFKTADYEKTLNLQITLRDVLPPEHLSRFIVDVIRQLDLGVIYKKHRVQGAPPYAPEILLGLLCYGYATGVFSSRKIERAQARYEAEKAAHEAKVKAREEKAAQKGQKPRGKPPKPPTPGSRDKDQYNFTDPESRIMKNANNKGFDRHYNTQVVVDHDSRLIVGNWVCNHPHDQQAALPTIVTISPALSLVKNANLDTGYFSQDNIAGLQARGIDPYIATGRSPHHQGWRAFFLDHPEPPAADASLTEQMAYKLRTEIGKSLYRLRKSTVEPVIGIMKEVMGFRQFLLSGLGAAGGEWTLVCLAYNLKRLHVLQSG